MHIVLVNPEIPQNTGSIGRLCTVSKSPLHLIHPLGFSLDEKLLRRAGLDYWDRLDLRLYDSYGDFLKKNHGATCYFLSSKAKAPYTQIKYSPDDFLIFGPETRGLDPHILRENPDRSITIPMMDPNSRSINLAQAVSIVLYEGLRQLHGGWFGGAEGLDTNDIPQSR